MQKEPRLRQAQRGVIAALLCLAFAVGLFDRRSLQESHTDYQDQPNQCENRNCPGSNAIAPIASNPNDQKGNGDGYWYREFLKPTDWLLVVFTLLLARYTKRLNVATGELKLSTDKLWEAGERHSERELCAFIFARAVGVTPHTETHALTGTYGTWEKPVAWTVCVIWENGGSTRSKALFSHVSTNFFDGEMPDDFSFPDLGDTTRIASMIGPKSQIFSSAFRFDVTDPRVRDVHAGKKHLYIWGWAEYDDIFEGTERHRTEFCYEIFFIGDPFPNKTQFAQRMHRLHNAADEDCRYPMKTPRSA